MRVARDGILGVGLIGTGRVGEIRVDCYRGLPGVELCAAADNDPARLRDFASRHEIPNVHENWQELINRDDVSVVHVATPNCLHGEMAIASARAGKHVVCEKPLCLTLEEADLLIDTCRANGVKLCYAERFCFAPKLVWAKQMADSGRIGEVRCVKYNRKFHKPSPPTAWDRRLAGGGVLVDVGVHGIEYCRWVMDKNPVETVYAQLDAHLRDNNSGMEDHSIVIMEFGEGRTALVESSWALRGLVQSQAEILGTEGVLYADIVGGAQVFTLKGQNLDPQGEQWLFGGYRSISEQGFPQEIAHYMECIRDDVEPRECGEDGRAVLEIVMAAYHSAGTGRKVNLPFRPEGIERPVDLWQRNQTS